MKAAVFDRTTPIEQLPQFLTIEETRAYLRIGRALAYELARQHGIRLGRHVRLPREALRALTTKSQSGT